MTELKRPFIKMVRDYIKKDYKKDSKCFACKSTSNLELHHLYSLSELLNNWLDSNKITNVDTIEQASELRELFVQDNAEKLSNNNLVTLCKAHHNNLHSIYGQRYSNHLVPKVSKWLNIQREKYE